MKISFPDLSYKDSLFVCNLERLDSTLAMSRLSVIYLTKLKTRLMFCTTFLPGKLSTSISVTRDNYHFELPAAKTMRYLNSFIPYCIRKRY
jgi:hypothetical protein